MFSVLLLVLPIFALILVGWLARRLGLLGAQSSTELNRFVVSLALPALLFDVVSNAEWRDLWDPGFIAAFAIATGATFAITILLTLRRTGSLADAAIDGLNAGYGNTGFVGIPLVLAALGREALAPTTVSTIITVCLMFSTAIVLVEASLHSERRKIEVIAEVARSLIRNPLLIASAVGALISLAGIHLPSGIGTCVKMIAAAASPCALIALGLFLADKRKARQGDTRSIVTLTGLKLIFQPALVWLLATFVFALPPLLKHTAVLVAALPTGTGPFMLAELYDREAGVTSATILVTTALSVITISAYLAMVA